MEVDDGNLGLKEYFVCYGLTINFVNFRQKKLISISNLPLIFD
jgi:hypothetical protein